LGYYKDPEATAKVLGEDGSLDIGDYGSKNPDGSINYKGRANNIINTSTGLKIYAEQLEMPLKGVKYIQNIIVYEGRDNNGNAIIAALIVADEDAIRKTFGDTTRTVEENRVLIEREIRKCEQDNRVTSEERIQKIDISRTPFPTTFKAETNRKEVLAHLNEYLYLKPDTPEDSINDDLSVLGARVNAQAHLGQTVAALTAIQDKRESKELPTRGDE